MITIAEALTYEPITKKALAAKAGIKPRRIERAVQAARLGGALICSDDRGYWLARSSTELRDTSRRLRRRYITQALTARAVRRAAGRMEAREALPLAFEWDAA